MGGISIWQLLIILLIVGIPVTMYFVISGGPKGGIERPLKFFHWSFWILVAAIALVLVVAAAADDPESVGPVLGLIALPLTVAWWSYLIALGLLASRTGGRWVLWVGLTLITSLFGLLVSYLMMTSRTKRPVTKLQ